MSNWGIGLLFSPGPGGRPEVLYLRDVESHCSACGLERVERFYSATSFHALTLRRLEALLESAPDAVTAPCAQCDAPMDAHDAVRWLLHYGFAGGDGLVQGFGTREGGRRWLLSPHARIDVQLVPEWDAALDASNREVDTLDDDTLLTLFGRVLNPKEAVRRAVAAAPVFSARVPHRIERLADGLAVVLAPHGALDEAWVRRDLACLDAADDTDDGTSDDAGESGGTWQIEPLAVAGEATLGFPAAPDEWLADVAARHPRLDVFGAARHGAAIAGLRAAIDTFTVAVTLEPRDDAADVLELRAPGDPDMPPIAFPLADICREAARTMAAPADIARLEIDRALAGLTGLLGTDDDDTDDDDAYPDVLGTWLNGESFDSLVLRGTDPWLARGDAVFETVRVQAGRPMFLDLHRQRLADSLAACALGAVADDRLDHALAPALEVAAEQPWPCSLRFTVASPSQADGDLRIVVVLSRYREADAEGYAAGVMCTLVDVPHPGLGALGKSVSWQWSQVARRRARAAGFDEALIGRDARVVESDSAAVLWHEHGGWFTPQSAEGPLPSVTLRALRRAGVGVAEASATVERLAAADAVCLLSSLRLAMGVARIDGVAYARCDEHAAPLRRLLLDAHDA